MNILPLMTNAAFIQNEMPGYKRRNEPVFESMANGLTPAEAAWFNQRMICRHNDSSWQPLLHDLTKTEAFSQASCSGAARKMHAATSDALEDDGFFSFICLKATMSAYSIALMH